LRREGDLRDWYIETFDSIDTNVALTSDGDAGEGLFPRMDSSRQIGTVAPARRYLGSLLFFFLAIALGLASITLTYAASRLASSAIGAVLASQGPTGSCSVALASHSTEKVRMECEPIWRSAWAAQKALPKDAAWDRKLANKLRNAVDDAGTIALIAPLLLSYAAILALILAGGACDARSLVRGARRQP